MKLAERKTLIIFLFCFKISRKDFIHTVPGLACVSIKK